MDEFEFIQSITQKNYKQASLIKGIGDDGAVFRQTYQDTVTAVDTFVENVHFSRKTMQPFHIGYRVLGANISDMAAMGCDPAYFLISMVIPKNWSEEELHQIYKGMYKLASKHKMDLIGGDTVSGDQLVISVTVIGFVDKNKSRYRSHARVNDIVFVTGTLGDSAAGFHILSKVSEEYHSSFQYFIDRHRMPKPRVAFANKLQMLTRVSLNDISDGIANEANEIADASQVTMHIEYNKLPQHQLIKNFTSDQQRDWTLFGGEDFELIGTVPENDWPYLLDVAEQTNTRVTKVGYVTDNKQTNGKVFLNEQNNSYLLKKKGYTHLK